MTFRTGRFLKSAGSFFWLLIVAMPAVSPAQGRRPTPTIREADFSNQPFLLLEDVAKALKGQLHGHAVSQRVDLSFRSHQIQFFIASTKTIVDGQTSALESPTIKDARGLWVPKSFFTSGPLSRAFRDRIDLGPVEVAEKPLPAPGPMPGPAPSLRGPATDSMAGTKQPPPLNVEIATQPSVARNDIQTVEPQVAPHAIRRIVLDPGHGGKDPGALGARGTQEKEITLWMAKELADALREKGFEVLLTRMDDSFVPLAARAALANKYKADLFISVHCNASISSKMNGFEVYFLSEKASNPHAEAVARKENASLEFEGKKPSNEVQAVLQSLVRNANINLAAQLGTLIDRQVAQKLSQRDLGVKQAAFYVLRGAQMPAVLIELGFLTNKKEERLLNDTRYRGRLIQAIESSILEYDRKQQELRKRG